MKAHLKSLSRQISQILKKADLKEKHYKNNPDLARWLEPEDPILEVFLVEKNRTKTFKGEQGSIRVSPLYGI